jgi:hypothetical protein
MVAYGADTVEGIRMRAPGAPGARVVPIDESWGDKPLFPDAAARKQAAMTTLPRKDAVDIYKKLQAEIAVQPTSEALGEWIEVNEGRVKLLHPEWQEIMRMHCRERLLELQNQEAGHDADGVVWEDTAERPLTDEEKVEAFRQSLKAKPAPEPVKATVSDDGLDIPAMFRRKPPEESVPVKEHVRRPPLRQPVQQPIDFRFSRPA